MSCTICQNAGKNNKSEEQVFATFYFAAGYGLQKTALHVQGK
jgi:hypothetical protein